MKVGILGASGYTGLELVRILLRHPELEIAVVTSEQQAGRPLGEALPSLRDAAEAWREAVHARAQAWIAWPSGRSWLASVCCRVWSPVTRLWSWVWAVLHAVQSR